MTAVKECIKKRWEDDIWIILYFLPFHCEAASILWRLDWIATFTAAKNPLRKKMNRAVFTWSVFANL